MTLINSFILLFFHSIKPLLSTDAEPGVGIERCVGQVLCPREDYMKRLLLFRQSY